jgi:lauroyl/myristoyl acyltransferase
VFLAASRELVVHSYQTALSPYVAIGGLRSCGIGHGNDSDPGLTFLLGYPGSPTVWRHGERLFFGVFKILPLDCASAVGGDLARRSGPFLSVSRHARRNVRRTFPELSETEIAELIGGMWSNLGRVAAEYPRLREICVFEPGGRVERHGFEHVDRAVAAGRRMIVFSGHIANWEIGMLARVQHGISVAQIYRALTIH